MEDHRIKRSDDDFELLNDLKEPPGYSKEYPSYISKQHEFGEGFNTFFDEINSLVHEYKVEISLVAEYGKMFLIVDGRLLKDDNTLRTKLNALEVKMNGICQYCGNSESESLHIEFPYLTACKSGKCVSHSEILYSNGVLFNTNKNDSLVGFIVYSRS